MYIYKLNLFFALYQAVCSVYSLVINHAVFNSRNYTTDNARRILSTGLMWAQVRVKWWRPIISLHMIESLDHLHQLHINILACQNNIIQAYKFPKIKTTLDMSW